jgi:hypothetical protein
LELPQVTLSTVLFVVLCFGGCYARQPNLSRRAFSLVALTLQIFFGLRWFGGHERLRHEEGSSALSTSVRGLNTQVRHALQLPSCRQPLTFVQQF